MNCEQTQLLIIDFIDGELDSKQTKQFLLHTEQCEACQSELKALQQTMSQTTASNIPQPDEAFFKSFPTQVLNEYKIQKNNAQTSQPGKNKTSENKPKFIQLVQNWWLENSAPNLAAQAMLLVLTIGGTYFIVEKASIPSFDSSPLYARLQNEPGLSAYIDKNNIMENANNFGFASKPLTANSYLAGKLYSETLLMVAAGKDALAAKNLTKISRVLGDHVNTQLNKEFIFQRQMLHDNRISKKDKITSLAKLYSQIKDSIQQSGNKLSIFFITGSWLMDLKIAVTIGSYNKRLQEKQANYIINTFVEFKAPKSVIKKLTVIKSIMNKNKISKSDANKISILINDLHLLLG